MKKSLFNLSVIVALTMMTLGAGSAAAQKRHFGLLVSANYSGSGLGAFYTPAVFAEKKRMLISLAPVINPNNLKHPGAQLNFDISLKEQNRLNLKNIHAYEDFQSPWELYVFCKFLYRPQSQLSRVAKRLEQAPVQRDQNTEDPNANPPLPPSVTIETLKFTTYAGYAGFGMKVRLNSNFKWKTGIGMGAYYSPDLPKGLWHSNLGPALHVTSGLQWNII